MKKVFNVVLLAAILLGLPLSSCASTRAGSSSAEDKTEWYGISSVDQLKGKWLCPDDGTYYAYPAEFNGDGKNYLVYAMAEVDATDEWKSLSDEVKLTLDELWEKNKTEALVVYSDKFGNTFPFAESNGCVINLEFRKEGNKIYRRQVYYFSEFVLNQNLDFFMLNENENLLKERGVFRTNSMTMPDMSEGTQIYSQL